MILFRFLIIAILALNLFSSPSLAGMDSKQNMGVYVSFHGDPPPSAMGLNLSLNMHMLRFTGGIGSYTTALSNIPAGTLNYTLMPIGYAFYWLGDVFGQILTKGKVRTHKDYSDYRLKYDSVNSIFSYGAAAKIVPMTGPYSPLVGVGYSRYETSGAPYGLADRGGFIYFPVGIEYSHDRLDVGIGYNICTSIHQAASGMYLNLGTLF